MPVPKIGRGASSLTKTIRANLGNALGLATTETSAAKVEPSNNDGESPTSPTTVTDTPKTPKKSSKEPTTSAKNTTDFSSSNTTTWAQLLENKTSENVMVWADQMLVKDRSLGQKLTFADDVAAFVAKRAAGWSSTNEQAVDKILAWLRDRNPKFGNYTVEDAVMYYKKNAVMLF